MSAYCLAVEPASHRPSGLIPVEIAVSRLAVALVSGGRDLQALVVDESRRFRSKYLDLPTPLVVEWPGYVSLEPADTERVTRRVLFARDRYQCQYCGFQATPGRALKQLTVDHVKPACLFPSRKAATTWDNVCAACRACNQAKADHLPWQCGMYPAQTPKRPHAVQVQFAGRLNDLQRDYVRDYFGLQEDDIVL